LWFSSGKKSARAKPNGLQGSPGEFAEGPIEGLLRAVSKPPSEAPVTAPI